MNRIEKKFEQLKREKRKALIIFITAGHPSLQITGKLILEMESKGADIIELGVPFSDPMADGPVIQKSSHQALKKKVNLKKILSLIKETRKNTEIPLLLMSYFNPIYNFGLVKFSKECQEKGLDGVIIPDLILEEAQQWKKISSDIGLANVFLATPTTSLKRMRKIAADTEGFLYYVSRTGVTGTREKINKKIKEELFLAKKVSGKMPVVCGFGISNDKQAREISEYCDGVIIGSAIVEIIEEGKNPQEILSKVGRFVSQVRREMDKR
ncbi:tryptophan synthase subunit alpha [bacterium]|nr:tryptophan synthase subunit alpha [bacterium]